MEALDEAIAIAGGGTALARALKRGATLISMWKARGSVPAEYCPDIEEITGIACELLRPDVKWYVLRRRMAPIRRPAAEVEESDAV